MMTENIVIEEELLVLDVGGGADGSGAVKTTFPNSTIHRLDVDKKTKPDVVQDITKPLRKDIHGKYDVLFLSHVLEHIERKKLVSTLKNLLRALKPNGEVWVIVPALEWAAREILNDNPSPVLQGVLYGSQDNPWQYHKSGFTLGGLRALMEHVGLATRYALRNDFVVSLDDRKFNALQNVVIGLKHDEVNDE